MNESKSHDGDAPNEISPLLTATEATSSALSPEVLSTLKYEILICSVGCLFAYFLNGLVALALSANIEAIAENVGVTSLDIGSIFIARGVGAVLSCFLYVLMVTFVAATHIMWGLLTLLPLVTVLITVCTSEAWMYFLFFSFGLVNGGITAGAICCIRNMHLGPWLSVIMFLSYISAAMSFVMQAVTPSMEVDFYIFAGMEA